MSHFFQNLKFANHTKLCLDTFLLDMRLSDKFAVPEELNKTVQQN